MNNTYFKWGIVAIIFIVMAIVLYGLYINIVSNAHVQKMTQAQYAAVIGSKAVYREIHPSLTNSNISIQAEWMEDVQAQLEGVITEIFVQVGSHVEAGDVIATVENIDLPGQLAQVDGLISQAQAKVSSAEQDVDRCKILVEQNAVASKQYDDAKTTLSIAQGELSATLAQRQQLVIKQTQKLIIAPKAGNILSLYCQQGYYIRSGEAICLIADFSKMTFQLIVDDEIANNFRDITYFYIPIDNVLLKSKAYDIRDIQKNGYNSLVLAKLTQVNPPFVIKSAVRTMKWEIIGQGAAVEPTTYTDLDIIAKQGKNILAVPLSAVISHNSSHREIASVFVVNADQRLVKRKVTLGRRDDQFIEILTGLEAGEIVITSGKQGLESDQVVRVKVIGEENAQNE